MMNEATRALAERSTVVDCGEGWFEVSVLTRRQGFPFQAITTVHLPGLVEGDLLEPPADLVERALAAFSAV